MVNEQVTTIELTAGTPSTVEFSGAYPYYWVDNRSAGDVYASLGTPEAGTDGTYAIEAGSQLRISGGAFNTKLTLLGSGKVQVIASAIASCPFKGAMGGGDYAVAGASSYTLNNAVDYPLLGLNLYGKSTQDGTPTPDVPVDIVSVGDNGSIEVQTCGKNLFPWNDYSKSPLYFWSTDSSVKGVKNTDVIEFTLNSNQERFGGLTLSSKDFNDIMKNYNGKTIVLSWEMKADNTDIAAPMACGWQRRYDSYTPTTSWAKYTNIFKVNTEYINNNITWYGKSNSTTTIFIRNIQIEIGDTATEYEPYKGNTASITSSLPLCGIPVGSGGNYTDSTGQQWVCDTLVYNADGTGKIIKNIRKYTFTGTDEGGIWMLNGSINSTKNRFQFKITDENIKAVYDKSKFTSATKSRILCDKYKAVTSNDTWNLKNGIAASHTAGYIAIYDENYATISTINDWIAYLAENPVTVIYQLNKPQEIELTASEMAQLRELQTFDGVTNITNGSGADMDVKICTNKMLAEYVFPITTGLQKQIDELKAAVLSLGGNV